MKKDYKNLLINVLGVLDCISDKHFMLDCWGSNPTRNTLVTSCSEAIEILDDYSFFDLKSSNLGVWKDIVDGFSEGLIYDLIYLAKKIDVFYDFDVQVQDLLADNNWIEIMITAKGTANKLKTELANNGTISGYSSSGSEP